MSFTQNDKIEPDFDNEPATEATPTWRGFGISISLVTIGAVVLVFFGLAFLAYSLSSKDAQPLYPILPTATLTSVTPDYSPAILTFAELNDDPSLYHGRRIQVSGTFTPIDKPDCLDYTGPLIQWSLVSDELQLNAVGFENLLAFLSPGTEMTVWGIWTAYKGPVGCGKQPPEETVWYLTVERILEPNPLIGINGVILTVIPGEPLPTFSGIETPEFDTPDLTPTAEGAIDETPTPTIEQPGSTMVATPTLELTILPGTPLITPGITASATVTPDFGTTPGTTPTIDLTITTEPTAGTPGTSSPPLPTSTPSSGYPPQSSPTATTPSGYP